MVTVVPGLYATWASWLEAFGRGEDLPTGHLPVIDLHLGPEAHQRLMRRVNLALVARQKLWSERVMRDLGRAGSEAGISRALTDARSGLRAFALLARLPALPQAVRIEIGQVMAAFVDDTQTELEKQLLRASRDARLVAIARGLPLAAGLLTPTRPAGSAPRADHPVAATGPGGRPRVT